MSFPHKCGQKSGYGVFNAVVAAFSQIFCAFPHSFQIHRKLPPLLNFLEGPFSCWHTNLRYASRIREDFPPRTFLHVLLTYGALCWAFTIYWKSPRTFYCPRTGPWPNILFRALTPTIVQINNSKKFVQEIKELGLNQIFFLKKKTLINKPKLACVLLKIIVGSQIVAHTQMETGDGPNKSNTINL